EQQAILVRCPSRLGGEPPGLQTAIHVASDHGLGVADVDEEELHSRVSAEGAERRTPRSGTNISPTRSRGRLSINRTRPRWPATARKAGRSSRSITRARSWSASAT